MTARGSWAPRRSERARRSYDDGVTPGRREAGRRAAGGGAAPLLALALLLAGCSGDEAPDVRTAPVQRADVVEVVEAPGTVQARSSATLRAPADATVAEVLVEDGATVQAGDVILRLDSPAARKRLRQAREAEAQAARAVRVDLGDPAAGAAGAPGEDAGLEAAQRAAEAAAEEAFRGAEEAAGGIPDERARTQALAAVAAARAQYAATQAQLRAAQAQLAAVESQSRTAARRLDDGVRALSEVLATLGESQRLQSRLAVEAAHRSVDALVVRAPVAGVVSLQAGDGSAGGGAGLDLSAALEQVPAELQGTAESLLGGGGGGAEVTGQLVAGAPVSAGQQLATVTDASSVSLVAQVDETDVLLVEPGVPAVVELDAVPAATYPATVTAVDVTPTTSARGGVSYLVRLTIGAGEDAEGSAAPRPRPGMSAVVGLQVRDSPAVVAVPASAVLRDGGDGASVWVVEEDRVRSRPVELGAEGEDLVEVRTGLRPGEVVVVAGADVVREGQQLP